GGEADMDTAIKPRDAAFPTVNDPIERENAEDVVRPRQRSSQLLGTRGQFIVGRLRRGDRDQLGVVRAIAVPDLQRDDGVGGDSRCQTVEFVPADVLPNGKRLLADDATKPPRIQLERERPRRFGRNAHTADSACRYDADDGFRFTFEPHPEKPSRKTTAA